MEENREQEHLTVLPMEVDGGVEFSGRGKEAKRCSEEDFELEVAGEENDAEDVNSEESGYLGEEAEPPVLIPEWVLEIIDHRSAEFVREAITAENILNTDNPLLVAITVTELLYRRAAKPGEFASADFIALANQVEEFVLCFLDALKTAPGVLRLFIRDPEVNVILENAIEQGQKKFFDYPILVEAMTDRWFGGRSDLQSSTFWRILLNIWCIFDIVLFPVMFFLAFVVEWMSKCKGESKSLDRIKKILDKHSENFRIPYFVFIRDILSYMALLGLHFAICVQPSQLTFSSLEWAILAFLFGRLLIEIKQLAYMGRNRSKGWRMKLKVLRSYVRDRWNVFDLAILTFYFCVVLPLRIVAWAMSKSVQDNRTLEIAGYFYGFNTMLLTLRAFGSILEAFEGFGTVQIAFFNIIRDAIVLVLQFVAITVAFSSTITKVFIVKRSKLTEDSEKYTWSNIAFQLALSLLELSDGLDYFKSTDLATEVIVQLLYVVYLVMALILLVNLLIALLSNTYQRVQDNSIREWQFRKAVTILTYCNYHPIPVPLNIIYTLAVAILGLIKKLCKKDDVGRKSCLKRRRSFDRHEESKIDYAYVKKFGLSRAYRQNYGDSFPPTSTAKLEQVLDDTVNIRRMINHVIFNTVERHKAFLPVGRQEWETTGYTAEEGRLLNFTNNGYNGGARYRTAFSPDFPHFEVMKLDLSQQFSFTIEVSFEKPLKDRYEKKEGSVAYRPDADRIFDNGESRRTKVCRVAQGDLIRCTIMFEEKRETDGKLQVPVVFSVNGMRITPLEGDPPVMEYCSDRPLYPYVYSYGRKTTFLARFCPREDVSYQDLQMQEMKSDSPNFSKGLQLEEIQSEITNVKAKLEEVHLVNRSLEAKLNAVLEKLG